MNRSTFIKTLFATGVISIIDPLWIADELLPDDEFILPFLSGNRKIRILRPKNGILSTAQAQYYRGYNYGSFAPYHQWYAYRQAQQVWQQRMRQWQAQQNWISRMHLQRMQTLMGRYQNYQNIGQPSMFPSIQSIYGYASNNQSNPTLFGLNGNAQPLAIQDTTKGAAKVFASINEAYNDQDEALKSAAPQSSEGNTYMPLPNGKKLSAKYFDTKNGDLKLSNELEEAADGSKGQLAQFVTRHGKHYEIV